MRQKQSSSPLSASDEAAAFHAAVTCKPLAMHALPANLADVALMPADACAAAGSMSVSWWYAEVAAGRAPQPVVRQPRCTRWTLHSVHAFWAAFAEKGTDQGVTAALIEKAKKASRAAQAKRAASSVMAE